MKQAFLAILSFAIVGASLTAHGQILDQSQSKPQVETSSSYTGLSVVRSQISGNSKGHDFKESSQGVKMYGGYNFNQYVGVESGLVVRKPADIFGAPDNGAQMKALYAVVTGSFPLTEQFALTSKAGYTRNSTRFGSTDLSGDKKFLKSSNNALMFGAGARFKFSDSISATVEYENFGKVVKESGVEAKGKSFSAGLTYTFGNTRP